MTINQPPEATLEVQSDGALRIVQPERRYRYLMSDGRVVDVIAARDDSDVRGLVIEHLAGVGRQETTLRIEGTVRLDGSRVPPVTRGKAKR